MGKQKAPRRVGEKEALSVGTTIRGSAQKLNLVAGLIRGRKVEEAMNILAFSKRAMARDAQKVLASVIGVSEAVVSRMRRGSFVLDRNSGKAFELAALFVRLYRSLDAIVGGDESVAKAWMRNPNTVLRAD